MKLKDIESGQKYIYEDDQKNNRGAYLYMRIDSLSTVCIHNGHKRQIVPEPSGDQHLNTEVSGEAEVILIRL